METGLWIGYIPPMDTIEPIIEDPELAREIERLLAEIIPDQDIRIDRLVRDLDHDGDECWKIDLHHRLPDVPTKPESRAKLLFEVREFLFSRGDDSFPHIRHRRPERQLSAVSP